MHTRELSGSYKRIEPGAAEHASHVKMVRATMETHKHPEIFHS
jgi:hypothetical protein